MSDEIGADGCIGGVPAHDYETPEDAFPPGPKPIVATNLDVIAQAVLNDKETENGK